MRTYSLHRPERCYLQFGFLPYDRRFGLEIGWGWIADAEEGAIAWHHWVAMRLPRWPFLYRYDERGLRWLCGLRLGQRCWVLL